MGSMNHAKSSSSSSSSSPTPPLSLGLTSVTYDGNRSDVNKGCIHLRASDLAGDKALFENLVQWQQPQHHDYMTPDAPLSQSNLPGGSLDLRFSWSASDMEPWRCRRTDGKKWRCYRDVAPDQKYCDRHTHKNRPRSRKPVELSSQQQQTLKHPHIQSDFTYPTNYPHSHTQYDESRFFPISQQPWQQPTHISPRLESKETGNLGDIFLCPPQHYEKKQVVGLQKFENDPHHHYHDVVTSASSLISSKTTSKHGITNKGLQPVSSLTLLMPGGNENDADNNENDFKLETGMVDYPWMSPSTPGGPLGEALCLRNARGGSNLAKDSL